MTAWAIDPSRYVCDREEQERRNLHRFPFPQYGWIPERDRAAVGLAQPLPLPSSAARCAWREDDLQVGASDGFTAPSSTFSPTATVYAVADAANLPNAVTINWQVLADNVTGQAANTHISQIDKSFNVTADSTVSLTLSPPTAGWPTGLYKIVATMVDGSTQRDQKSAEFTVTDSGAPAG